MRLFALMALLFSLLTPSWVHAQSCDDAICSHSGPAAELGCDGFCESLWDENPRSRKRLMDRTPAMIGDFFAGSPTRLMGMSTVDRLLVVANDLDAPAGPLNTAAALTITETGPVGIFETDLANIQQVQQLLQAGQPLPFAVNVGVIADDATLTTGQTVGQIQALLASTADGYDIIGLIAPPGTYINGVNALFQARNGTGGTTVLDTSGSGAVLQGGTDTLNGGEDFDAFYFFDYQIALNLPVPDASSGGVGRLKIAEGGSVLPQDRVYFRYNYFGDVAYTTGGLGISRFTPGFERTLYDGLLSLEVRTPFASGTATDVSTNGLASFGSTDTKFGNVTMYLKALLLQQDGLALSGGLGLSLPTADDVSVAMQGASPLLRIDNQAVHLQPFLGLFHSHSDRLYSHGFLQFDFAASGNDTYVNFDGSGLTRAGTLTDRNHLFIDYGIGYWLYRNDAKKGLTGVIPTFEIHHTTSISDADAVVAGPLTIGGAAGDTSLTNIVAGTTFEFGQNKNVTVAYTGSLDGDDQQFGDSLRLMVSQQR
ncbi:MAG: hypothetical protein AAF802_07365 [Planctomycetota bacterium]